MAERVPEDIVEELSRRLWDSFRGRRITLDVRDRPNYFAVRAFARRLLELAYEYGVEDPIHEIDWVAVLDPDVSREENTRLFENYLTSMGRKKVSPAEEVDEAITELERYLAYLREELERAPPEARPELETEIRKVESDIAEFRRAKRPRERRVKPPRKPAPSPPPPRAPLPLEELRARTEHWLRRIPRIYRIDWLRREPYVARISMHREAYGEVVRRVREWGGEVRREVPTRPPMRVVEVDFSGASPPPIPLTPEMERWVLWSKFSAVLTASGIRPEEHRVEFEDILERFADRPLEEKQRAVEELARKIVAAFRPPPAPAAVLPPELSERLEEIERELRELREVAGWRPRSAEDIRMLQEALLTAPGVMLRVDEEGHAFIGPDDESLQVLMSILDRWAVKWFMSCPVCRARLPGGALTPTSFVDHLIRVEGVVPPMFVDWLRRLARMLEESERRGMY